MCANILLRKIVGFALSITSKLPVQSWTKKTTLIYSRLLFRCTRMIKPVFGQKKTVFLAILKLFDETGSRFFEPLNLTIHFNWTSNPSGSWSIIDGNNLKMIPSWWLPVTYWFEKSTSSFVIKIQNGHQKPFFFGPKTGCFIRFHRE